MTRGAFPRRSFVHRDGTPGGALPSFMAQPAWDVFVRPAKREGGLLFVVEHRGRPVAGGVTAGAIHRVAAPELAAMNVLVTTRALARSGLERNLSRTRIRIERPVTIQAS